uniref:Complement component c3b, tandem duplicate 2 n=1 Tax=Gasterosteus aculeatus aculeatus TaxID=481459 RepID=G3Q8J4_GASAC
MWHIISAQQLPGRTAERIYHTAKRINSISICGSTSPVTPRRFTLLAPDLLRTDSQENNYLQANGVSTPVSVTITVMDFRSRAMLLRHAIQVTHQGQQSLCLPSDGLNPEEKENKFVYLKVDFGGFHSEERVLMVSFHAGYIFIQTDKPIYNPGDTVRFRAFASSLSFKAFDSSVTIDVTNPDGVVVKQVSRVRPADGVLDDTLLLSEIVNEGKWTLTAKFDHRQQNTFTSEFEVKKYVLPAFNVTLTPKKSFLNLEDSELQVEISARYLYGEPVQGTAYVVFGVKINQEMRRLPSVKQVSNLDGGVVSLSMEEIKRVYPNVKSLVGNSVYVKASVLTKSGGDLVEAQKTGIKIVESPYVLSFKDIPKFFKPGLPFDLTIEVNHHDGSAARNVLVHFGLLKEPILVSSGSTRVAVDMPAGGGPQTITAETVQADLRPEQQAKHQVTVRPYAAFDPRQQNYLHISTPTNAASLGDRLPLKLTVAPANPTHRALVTQVTYLVLSKGKILVGERADVTGQQVTSVGLTVTPEMMPSFRFVAFYVIPWEGREEVVSDSIWVDVADSCVGGLKVGPADGVHRDYAPGKNFKFQVRGDPGSKVNLVAVDNAVYLLNRDRLTQRKIWGTVELGDMGCTRGGGRDATSVFSDAGLLYASSAGVRTQTRQVLQCPRSARRRRSAELLRRKAQLEDHYREQLQRRCCRDGLREIPMRYSCTRRSLYITEGWECMRAFRYCCATFRDQEFNTEIPTTVPPWTTAPPTTTTSRPRPTYVALHLERERVMERAHSPVLAARPEAELQLTHSNANKMAEKEAEDEEEEEEEEEEYLDETQVYLRYKFYESWLWTDVHLPDRAEADGLAWKDLELPLPDSITEWGLLAVSASPHTGFCVAEPHNVKAWKRFFVDLKLPHSVARNEQVEIKAVVHNYGYDDVHVRESPHSSVLADSIDNSISEDSLASLIRMPGGCVEQNLASITLPLIASLYLERTNNWESVGVDRKAEALRYIRKGYQKQLAYRRSDGSYPPYRREGASTWITAYVVKVFSMAHSTTGIDEQQVCDPLLYLVHNKHRLPGGNFVEDNPVYDTTMTGGLRGDDPEVTLTSFVLIALSEAKQAGITCTGPNVEAVISETAEYLRRALGAAGRRPYTVAIASYALALLGEAQPFNPTPSLLRAAAAGGSHWLDTHNPLFTLEATGYALLALVKLGRLDEAAAPFKWLNSQRRRGGSFGSTQSTMVVLQALSEYLINKPPPGDLSLDVDVRLTGRKEIRYHFNPRTAYAARSSRLPANLDLEVEARGNGEGILEVVTFYNQLHEVDDKTSCKDFELLVTIEESSETPPADVEKSYQMSIRVRALGPTDVRMVVLDISLPTGFSPETSDLEKLSNSVDRYINHFQVVDNLSDRGSLIIHLFKVSHKEPEVLIFRLQQRFRVGLLQPSSVTVYEYYNPDHRCSHTYTPREDREELSQICRNDACRCAQGDCCVSRSDSENVPHQERETFACKTLHHVFKVKVLNVSQSYYDKYEMEITQVIKLGIEAGVEVGQRRLFMSHGGCRDGLVLNQGSQYLIMGPTEDQWNADADTGRSVYVLGKDTWVERWPSPTECSSTDGLSDKCRSLKDAATELSVNGCRL